MKRYDSLSAYATRILREMGGDRSLIVHCPQTSQTILTCRTCLRRRRVRMATFVSLCSNKLIRKFHTHRPKSGGFCVYGYKLAAAGRQLILESPEEKDA